MPAVLPGIEMVVLPVTFIGGKSEKKKKTSLYLVSAPRLSVISGFRYIPDSSSGKIKPF